MPKQELIEIARSFSQKVSNPNNRFENMDFFCSAKKEIPVEGSIEISEQLFAFCQDEVEKSVRNYQLGCLPIPSQPEPPKYETPQQKQNLQDKGDEVFGEEKFKEANKEVDNIPTIQAE